MLPLGGLLKREVRTLAAELGIPSEIIDKAPSAGLWKGQTDEAEIGMSYEELDAVISAIESGQTQEINKSSLAKVKRLMEISRHKRQPIPVFIP